MTSKRELEERVSDLRWKLDKAALAVKIEEDHAERYRKEVERLERKVGRLENSLALAKGDLHNAGKALEVLAPMLYKRYSPEGVLRWDDLIADAKRVEEYNATTEVLHFIEASQEGEPF